MINPADHLSASSAELPQGKMSGGASVAGFSVPARVGTVALVVLGLSVVVTQQGAAAAISTSNANYRVTSAGTGVIDGDDLAPPLARGWSSRLGSVGYPVIANDQVYAVTSTTATARAINVYDVSLTTGSIAWKRSLPDTVNGDVAYGNGVLAVTESNGIVGLDAATGSQRWAITGAVDTEQIPVASGDALYAEGPTGVERVDLTDGTVVWSSRIMGAPVASDGEVFVQNGHDTITQLDATTGAVLSQHANTTEGGTDRTSGTIYRGHVYAVEEQDDIVLDSDGLAVTGSFTSDPFPSFDGADMYAITQSEAFYRATLHAEDLRTGTVRWSEQLGALSNYAPPLADNGYIYVANLAGEVSAYRESDGLRVWAVNLGQPLSDISGHLGMSAAHGRLVVATATGLVSFTGSGPTGCTNACEALPVDSSVRDTEATDQSSSALVDAAHDSDEPDAHVSTPLAQRWGATVDGTPSFVLNADGMTYTVVTHPGQNTGKDLLAFDDITGVQTWGPIDVGSDTNNDSDMAYSSGVLVVVPIEGVVEGRSALTGALLWTREVPLARHVVAVDGRVIVEAKATTALNPTDGSVEWSIDGGGTSVAAEGGILYMGATGELAAIDIADGAPLWDEYLADNNQVDDLSVAGGDVIAEGPGALDVLDGQTGASKLTSRLPETVAAYDPTSRYVIEAGTLKKLPLTGTKAEWALTGDQMFDGEAPLLIGRNVWIASAEGNLYEVNADTGREEWQGNDGCAVTGENHANLLAADGLLIISCSDRVIALSPSNSAPQTPPSAPVDLQSFGWNGEAYVAWTVPAYPATGIDEYRITAEPGGAHAITSSSTGGVVGGLKNGVAYTFSVQAHDAAGWGSASHPTLYAVVPRPGAWRLRPLPAPLGATLFPTAENRDGHIAVDVQYEYDTYLVAAGREGITADDTTKFVNTPTDATAINDHDDLVGGISGNAWTFIDGKLTAHPAMDSITGIDDAGRVTGTVYRRGVIRAIADSHGSASYLDPTVTATSHASAISTSGTVIGGDLNGKPTEWIPTGHALSTGGYLTASVHSISPDGQYLAGSGTDQFGYQEPIVWHGVGHTDLEGAYDCPIVAVSINDHGTLAGTSCPGGPVATIWSGTTPVDANQLADAPTAFLSEIVGIAADGKVAVNGTVLGVQEGFVLSPPSGDTTTIAPRLGSQSTYEAIKDQQVRATELANRPSPR